MSLRSQNQGKACKRFGKAEKGERLQNDPKVKEAKKQLKSIKAKRRARGG